MSRMISITNFYFSCYVTMIFVLDTPRICFSYQPCTKHFFSRLF